MNNDHSLEGGKHKNTFKFECSFCGKNSSPCSALSSLSHSFSMSVLKVLRYENDDMATAMSSSGADSVPVSGVAF